MLIIHLYYIIERVSDFNVILRGVKNFFIAINDDITYI